MSKMSEPAKTVLIAHIRATPSIFYLQTSLDLHKNEEPEVADAILDRMLELNPSLKEK